MLEEQRVALPELPSAARLRLEKQLGLKPYDAEVIVSQGRDLLEYFDSMLAAGADAKRASSWIQQDVMRTLKETNLSIKQFPIPGQRLAELLTAIDAGAVDNSRGKMIFQYMLEHPVGVQPAMSALGIQQVDEEALETLCRKVLADNPKVVSEAKAGNVKALGSLVGAAKKVNPNVDPKRFRELCEKLIESI
jgi:aspartyl-tRNA(Asn)/glutamyl-tRNA(Gln) amidotransferase subunit B